MPGVTAMIFDKVAATRTRQASLSEVLSAAGGRKSEEDSADRREREEDEEEKAAARAFLGCRSSSSAEAGEEEDAIGASPAETAAFAVTLSNEVTPQSQESLDWAREKTTALLSAATSGDGPKAFDVRRATSIAGVKRAQASALSGGIGSLFGGGRVCSACRMPTGSAERALCAACSRRPEVAGPRAEAARAALAEARRRFDETWGTCRACVVQGELTEEAAKKWKAEHRCGGESWKRAARGQVPDIEDCAGCAGAIAQALECEYKECRTWYARLRVSEDLTRAESEALLHPETAHQ